MSAAPVAEVLAVGAELLTGDVTDTNSGVVARELGAVGVPLVRTTAVVDDRDVIAAAAAEALQRSQIVIVTGGLGPTSDDVTEAALSGLGAAASLPNTVGSAAGLLHGQLAGRVLYALPGVPHEMAAMLRLSVIPDVRERFPDRAPTAGLVFRCAGAPEALLGRRVDARLAEHPLPGLTVAYLAGDAEVQVKLRAVADTEAEAASVISAAAPGVRAVLGSDCYGEGDVTLPGTVVRLLAERGETVAAAESLTAGLVSARIADVPGASAVLRGSVTAYATELKGSVLGVPGDTLERDGAVSETTAAAMAAGVRELMDSTWGMATTGVAGPDPQESHPAGTLCLGLAGPDGVVTRTIALPNGGRAWIRAASATLALDLLRRTANGRGSGS